MSCCCCHQHRSPTGPGHQATVPCSKSNILAVVRSAEWTRCVSTTCRTMLKACLGNVFNAQSRGAKSVQVITCIFCSTAKQAARARLVQPTRADREYECAIQSWLSRVDTRILPAHLQRAKLQSAEGMHAREIL